MNNDKLNEVFGIPTSNVIDGESKVVDGDTGEIVAKNDNLPSTTTKENFAISPLQKSEKEQQEDEEFKKNIDEDFEIARRNIKMVLDRSEELLDMSMRTVEMSEDPEAIEGAAKLLNSMTAASKHLLDLTKQRQDVYMKTRASGILGKALKENPNASVNLNQVNQNISFVGTSTDLQKLLADMKKEN